MLFKLFPNLRGEPFTRTSVDTPEYNCLAWAAGRSNQWWEPDKLGLFYWPPSASRENTLNGYCEAYESLGYKRCNSGDLESGHEKVVIYAFQGFPKHVARQLVDGNWTSKIGEDIDLTHTLKGLEGIEYGLPAIFLKRLRS